MRFANQYGLGVGCGRGAPIQSQRRPGIGSTFSCSAARSSRAGSATAKPTQTTPSTSQTRSAASTTSSRTVLLRSPGVEEVRAGGCGGVLVRRSLREAPAYDWKTESIFFCDSSQDLNVFDVGYCAPCIAKVESYIATFTTIRVFVWYGRNNSFAQCASVKNTIRHWQVAYSAIILANQFVIVLQSNISTRYPWSSRSPNLIT